MHSLIHQCAQSPWTAGGVVHVRENKTKPLEREGVMLRVALTVSVLFLPAEVAAAGGVFPAALGPQASGRR